jgi:hypothetical protein
LFSALAIIGCETQILINFFCPHNNEDKSSSFREPFKGIQCTIGEIYCCGGEYMGMMEDNKIKSEYIL